ncbi:tRNA 5-hydroxyuridine modification protein YegQ [Candidatus Methylocalor cossyra]|uniref:Peptidase YegQ n=1 Tax=Candidatus Methylocalor cossyra TaxID=3108543 RepID=A0ABP1C9K9_9GAMM
MQTVELLSPAGTLKSLRYAFAYGADAVYAGLPRYSLRVRNNEFLAPNLATGIAEAHRLGKAFYLAANVLPHNGKVKTFVKDLAPIVALGPDALIMADPGLILLARETWPDLAIHLSVQANTTNYAAVRFWQSVGIRRIILSRELSLDEIAEIRQLCPDMELEVFVHGALCIAYSGRCLLSGYFNHRDPNQGTCTNACRWPYGLIPARETPEGDLLPSQPLPSREGAAPTEDPGRHPLAEQVYLLEEPTRPGELMPVMEDEHGTYILNSKDLRAVEHVQQLVRIGVDCLKIEGRTKSYYYVARTAQVYRQAIDGALAGRPFDPHLLGVLENLAQRGYTDGFYLRHPSQEYQNYRRGHSQSHRQQFVGEITGYDPSAGLAEVLVKNKFAVGDRLELILPEGNRDWVLEHLEDLHGNPLPEAPGGGWQVRLPLPLGTDGRYGLIARYL